MKSITKTVFLVFTCLFVFSSCDPHIERPKTTLMYSEIVAMLQEYDNTKKNVLFNSLGKEDTRVNFYTIEELKAYLAYVEKLSKDKEIKLTGINFISAAYPSNHPKSSQRNHQTLILMPTTTIDGKDDVSFDPLNSIVGVPKTFKEMLEKYNYSWPYDNLYPSDKKAMVSLKSKSSVDSLPVSNNKAMFLSESTDSDEQSSAGNRMRPSPPN